MLCVVLLLCFWTTCNVTSFICLWLSVCGIKLYLCQHSAREIIKGKCAMSRLLSCDWIRGSHCQTQCHQRPICRLFVNITNGLVLLVSVIAQNILLNLTRQGSWKHNAASLLDLFTFLAGMLYSSFFSVFTWVLNDHFALPFHWLPAKQCQ